MRTIEGFADLGDTSVRGLTDAARDRGVFVFDLETSGFNPRTERIEGIAFYVPSETDDGTGGLRVWYPFVRDTMVVAVSHCDHCDVDVAILDPDKVHLHSCGNPYSSLEWQSLREPMDQYEVMTGLRELFEDESLTCVAHNIKFDASFMQLASGLESPIAILARWADSMLAHYVHDERLLRYGLKPSVKRVFGYEMTSYEEAVRERGFAYEVDKPLGVYAMDDVEWTWRLYDYSMKSIKKQDPTGKLERVFWDIEMPVAKIITEMQLTGVNIDRDWLLKVHDDLEFKKKDAFEDVMEAVNKRVRAASVEAAPGDQFGMFGGDDGTSPEVLKKGARDWRNCPPNFNAPRDVSHLLYEHPDKGGIGLPTAGLEASDSGVWPTSSKVLQRFRLRESIIVGGILDWRSYDTIDSSFARKIVGIVDNEPDGRLYAQFNQTGTVVGRLSSSNPINLMNQPRDRNLIRKAFCSMLEEEMQDDEDDILLFGCDYDQIELKVVAHLSKDEAMLSVYRAAGVCPENHGRGCAMFNDKGRCRHADIHQRTAEDVGVERQLAKPLNFGLLYRMGPRTFCSNAGLYTKLGRPRLRYARKLSKLWFKAYPKIKEYHEKHERNLARNRFLSFTLARRRRRLKQAFRDNEFKAVTQSIQFAVSGTAQDIMKTGMRRILEARDANIKNATSPRERELWSKVKFLLQVHDEILLQGPRALDAEIKEMVEVAMCGAANLDVPLTATCESGRTWDCVH